MSTRVIENKVDRLTTIMVAPLMTCSARIPVYTLIIAAFIPNKTIWGGIGLQGLVMFCVYAIGILSALAVAWIMKRFIWRQRAEPFLMEMPGYKWPTARNVLMGLWQRATIFLRRAGTVILALMIVIWFLCSFPGAPVGATEPAINYSLAGVLGHWLEPVLRPIGFNWQITIALIPGMAAREVAVGALGTVYALSGSAEGTEQALQAALAASWSLPTALALLAWYIFAPQCVSTLAVVKRETNSWKWPIVMFVYMSSLAYGAAFLTFHIAQWAVAA
jgi:ferrous iron transport protein B